MVAGPETVHARESCVRRCPIKASRLPGDAVPFTVVPVMVPVSCLPFILRSFGRVGDLGGHADVAVM